MSLLSVLLEAIPTLDPATSRRLLPLAQYRQHAIGTLLLQEGMPWQRFIYLQRGLCRLYYLDADGREINKNFLQEGDCLWPVSEPASVMLADFRLEALEPSMTLELPYLPLRAELEQQGLWQPFAGPILARLLHHKCERERQLQSLSPEARYQHFCQHYPALLCRLKGYHIASYLGITQVSLSRIRRRLINKG